MQNSFSFSRLWLLIKKQWFDNSKLYLLSLMALVGLLIIIFTTWWLANKYDYRFEEDNTYLIFLIMLFVSGLIFSSTTFSTLADKAKGIYWISIPATPGEKLGAGFFYSFIVFPIIYLLSFWIIKHITFFFIGLNPQNLIVKSSPNNIFIKFVLPNFIIAFFAFQALFMLGSVYFERFAFIKTVLSIFVIGFLFVMFTQYIVHNLLPENFGFNGAIFRVYENGQTTQKIFPAPKWFENVLFPLAKFIWVPILLTATYFRLKEKEI